MDLDALIARYRRTVTGVENESCDCGGQLLAGDEWRARGCGYLYEYLFDITFRDTLQDAIDAGLLASDQAMRVRDADERLKALLARNEVDTTGVRFWNNGVPRAISD